MGLDDQNAIRMAKGGEPYPRTSNKYAPHNVPGYRNMLDLCHYTGLEAAVQEYPTDSICVAGRTYGPFGDSWVSEEIVDSLNKDLSEPETCRFCHGDGWIDMRSKVSLATPKSPCSNCQKGQEYVTAQKVKAKQERERQREYLLRELDRLTIEFGNVEAQLMELDK